MYVLFIDIVKDTTDKITVNNENLSKLKCTLNVNIPANDYKNCLILH